jgi:uncharacterized protein involved in exopolysaccharide biosynthesis
MYPSFDAFEYVEYLRRRWRVLAGASIAALLLSLGISLLITKRYTATASIVIEPPGGNDIRLSTAVSPMYLESLKTYERFAGGDSLFAGAVDRFHLLDAGSSQSIEGLKRRVLKVNKLKDTKILEISATLHDPKLAQRLAQYIAEETVNTNRRESLASDQEFVEQAEKQVADAQRHLSELQQQWNKLAVSQPIESLQSEIEANVDFESKVQQQLVEAQAQAAEYEQQQAQDGKFAREQLQAARARAALLEKRSQLLEHTLTEKTAALAARTAQRAALETELKVAQTSYETVSARLHEYQASAGTHAEQLRVIDPGIVPEQPSSPNIFLNVAAALLLAFVSSLVYLSFAFVYRRRPIDFETPMTRGMRA